MGNKKPSKKDIDWANEKVKELRFKYPDLAFIKKESFQ